MIPPEDEADTLRVLVGYAYPAAEVVAPDARRFSRRWVVRSVRNLPPQDELRRLAGVLVAKATSVLRDAYGQHASEEQLKECSPAGSIVRLDEQHCVVVIESPVHQAAIGDDAAIGTWFILRGLDEAVGIDDLEGIPKRHWFALATAGDRPSPIHPSIDNLLRTELHARGCVRATEAGDLATPNETMRLGDFPDGPGGLADLLDVMVARREKVFRSTGVVGPEASRKSYDDVVLVIDAIKAVLATLTIGGAG